MLAAATAVATWLAASARKEAAKANAVVGLLTDMLKAASPTEMKGADYTLRELVDDFDATLGDQLAGQPEVEAMMRNIPRPGLQVPGQRQGAGAVRPGSRSSARRETGEDHPMTLGILCNLASWHFRQRNLWEAEKLSRDVLGRTGERSGAFAKVTLHATNVLANTYRLLGKRREAEALYGKMLESASRRPRRTWRRGPRPSTTSRPSPPMNAASTTPSA